jgi:AcrR family transcriptional regulator
MAAIRNATSVTDFKDALTKRMLEQVRAEPTRGFEELRQRARTDMACLTEKLGPIRAFIADVPERQAAGLLNGRTEKAERLPAETILSIATELESALANASEADNTYPLRRVHIAIGVLTGFISPRVNTPVTYPESDSDHVEGLIRSRVEQAESIIHDVREALDTGNSGIALSTPVPVHP